MADDVFLGFEPGVSHARPAALLALAWSRDGVPAVVAHQLIAPRHRHGADRRRAVLEGCWQWSASLAAARRILAQGYVRCEDDPALTLLCGGFELLAVQARRPCYALPADQIAGWLTGRRQASTTELLAAVALRYGLQVPVPFAGALCVALATAIAHRLPLRAWEVARGAR